MGRKDTGGKGANAAFIGGLLQRGGIILHFLPQKQEIRHFEPFFKGQVVI
jgi:hypothetical protein